MNHVHVMGGREYFHVEPEKQAPVNGKELGAYGGSLVSLHSCSEGQETIQALMPPPLSLSLSLLFSRSFEKLNQ